jgi:succinoglycan biosynthesis protein ExoM
MSHLLSAPVIAVLTYQRTDLLSDLLAALVEQARTVEPAATVVVVDNDPGASAEPVVSGWAGRGVRYVHEPRPGISAARNRALDEGGDAEVLVFLDDDEIPSPGWLAHLVGAWRAWGCAAVAGPVPPRFAGPVDPWVLGSGVFDRPERATGLLLPGAGAGNLLLDLRVVRGLGLRFDEGLGLTGGEDTLFTHELIRLGGEIRWCAEAEAVELVPADRLTRRWARQRSFRSASSWSRAELHLAGSAAARWRLRASVAAKTAGRSAQGLVGWTVAALTGSPGRRGRAVCTMASYAGLLAGAFGYVRAEYARPQTDRLAAEPTGAAA